MQIIIQNSVDAPLYQQIYEQIKTSIIKGLVSEGDSLPSIRSLSRELKVSVITTTRAYADLEKDGYITTVQGKGSYVSKLNTPNIEEDLLSNIKEHFVEIQKASKLLKQTDQELLDLLKSWMKEGTQDE